MDVIANVLVVFVAYSINVVVTVVVIGAVDVGVSFGSVSVVMASVCC